MIHQYRHQKEKKKKKNVRPTIGLSSQPSRPSQPCWGARNLCSYLTNLASRRPSLRRHRTSSPTVFCFAFSSARHHAGRAQAWVYILVRLSVSAFFTQHGPVCLFWRLKTSMSVTVTLTGVRQQSGRRCFFLGPGCLSRCQGALSCIKDCWGLCINRLPTQAVRGHEMDMRSAVTESSTSDSARPNLWLMAAKFYVHPPLPHTTHPRSPPRLVSRLGPSANVDACRCRVVRSYMGYYNKNAPRACRRPNTTCPAGLTRSLAPTRPGPPSSSAASARMQEQALCQPLKPQSHGGRSRGRVHMACPPRG
ncbi:hypothetical protein HDK90DRAFT_53991 [Phyllosticta capitalensis]|uniref:Uncharacterized protein n=2 Tax=Phyllosticta capitalensis TaxID=121624 RepID=A0ABR1YEV4_9PEZI